MKNIKVIGWKKGFNKLQFALLLQKEAGYSLSNSKEIVDQILNGNAVNIQIGQSCSNDFIIKAQQMGVIVV